MAAFKIIFIRIYNCLAPYSLIAYKWCKEHYEITAIIFLILFGLIDYLLPSYPNSISNIKNKGVLTVVASNEPVVQHALSKHYYGFEHDLLSKYASSIGVSLNIISVPYSELFHHLNSGKADIAIGGILNTSSTKGFAAVTVEWYQLTPTITYRRKQKRAKNIQQLANKPVYMSSRFLGLSLAEELNLISTKEPEYKLLSLVANGDIEHALSTNYKAKQAKLYFPNLNRSFLLPNKLGLVWALPKWHNKSLLADVNQFLEQAKQQQLPKQYAKKYLENYKKVDFADLVAIDKRIDKTLPQYRTLFKNAAYAADIDWFLLAALAYQESHWSNKVISPTGVKGIMQITKQTAKYLGVTDRLNQRTSIYAAARYIKDLYTRLPDSIQEPDRTWFAIAAYNAGLTHILRAHEKAKRLDLNANDWDTVANQVLIYLYSDNNEKTFPQGMQAQKYVDRIQVFTDILRFHSIHPEL